MSLTCFRRRPDLGHYRAAYLTAAASVCGARARAKTSSASASDSLGSSAAAATTTLGFPAFIALAISRARPVVNVDHNSRLRPSLRPAGTRSGVSQVVAKHI